ncbi:MAG: hypothetical protein IKQ60_08325 [Candidatus Methanomethylophilaceae archaeon]|nr:hypothetical protein [Candidatus Methanomethylophilaceae archaeon]
MTANANNSHPKWIAAAIAMIFVLSAAAVCSDTASAAEGEEANTIDVDETFTNVLMLASALLSKEPSEGAKEISGEYDVGANEVLDDLVLKDGAVLNFSNSALMTVDDLFVEGNVKLVNKDGSDIGILAGSVYVAGVKCSKDDVRIYTDKSVSIDAKLESSGFFDPDSVTFDPSKGIKGSASAKISTDGFLGLSGAKDLRLYPGSGSVAVEMSASYDLGGFYKSLKDNLDGVVLDKSSTAKLVDYLYNKMVYPDVSFVAKVAKASYDGTTVSDSTVTFASSQASKSMSLGVSIGSGEGDTACDKLVLNASFSLLKAEVSGSAGTLVLKNMRTGIGASENSVEIKDLKFDFSSRGDKLVEVVAANIFDGPQAVVDALTDSDAAISGTSNFQAGSVKGSGSSASEGVPASFSFQAEGMEYHADVDSKTGTSVRGSTSELSYHVEGKGVKQSLRLTDFSEDITTSEKNVFSILKFVKFEEKAQDPEGAGIPVDADYKAAALDLLDGMTVKGSVSIGTLDQVLTVGTEGADFRETKASMTGSDKANFKSAVDVKFSTDKATERITLAGTLTPQFSDSAVGYSKVVSSGSSGVEGDEITMKNIKMDVQPLKVETALDDIKDLSKLAAGIDMKVSLKANVEKNSWSTGSGTTAYAERVSMGKAAFDTNIVELAGLPTAELPASHGDSLAIDSYKVSDRGSVDMKSFADVVAKADSSSRIKGASYEYKFDAAGAESLHMAGTETVVDGKDVKYTKASDVDSVAYLVKNEAGYYDVATDKPAGSSIPVFNTQGAPAPSNGGSGDSTMLYVAIAVIALVLIALVAYFLMKKRGSGA